MLGQVRGVGVGGGGGAGGSLISWRKNRTGLIKRSVYKPA